MSISRVSSKGQVTLPADVRRALDIEQGDDLIFDLAPDRSVNLRVVKRKRLSDLYGALPATRSFPGKEEIREEVGQALGRSSSMKKRTA
jgi:AbrB family looped-hinge helix DNA binding protein